ncbi:GNAT family N-acetyltransferase [Actibacterium lipolyticum]|uniref:Mycothiol acetyltransferase n=1 Tax=Actibacterium lipolyticum TaxID=1524263 RepID=A0A238KGH4_9RHOB|nr:GNAT family N-acetyltransferase [Actibacterium lipolyticum]SMX41858.1 Mycothiol acetyltransferase [Actibacterium lipolyticum]
MSILNLAGPDDINRVLPMIASYHAHAGIQTTEQQRRDALTALYGEDIQAAIWLIGPARAPVGYIAVSFGFSIELGGRDAFIDEFFIRDAVRGRGMGSQALHLILPMLKQMGIKAVHMEVDHQNTAAAKLYERAGFRARSQNYLMTRTM